MIALVGLQPGMVILFNSDGGCRVPGALATGKLSTALLAGFLVREVLDVL